VAPLLARHGLSGSSAQGLRALLEVLAEDPTAPTTVREPAAAADVHLADSLVALELGVVRDADAVADIGAGAGFPGLALAAALPVTTVRLIEGAGRKCAFMRRAAARAGLRNAEIVHSRVEALGASVEPVDLVTARAVAPLAVVAEYAAPLLGLGGSLVAWKGRRDADEEHEAIQAASELGLERVDVVAVSPYPAARHRHLHVYRKTSPTPDRFPRRPGVARKRSGGARRISANSAKTPTRQDL
jgi:16S rRNA (guanine527-N7)-methyltransferase